MKEKSKNNMLQRYRWTISSSGNEKPKFSGQSENLYSIT